MTGIYCSGKDSAALTNKKQVLYHITELNRRSAVIRRAERLFYCKIPHFVNNNAIDRVS